VAVNDDATLVIGSGNYFTAPVGTAMPEDLLVPGATWSNVGHTSLEEIFSITSEGGEATVIGTLQNKSLRTKYSARTETMTFTLQQFDVDGLKLYYGANAQILADGSVGVPAEPEPTEAAFLAVFVDGDNHFAFYAPKAEIYRADDLSIADTESLAGLPLGVKPMAYGANSYTYAVTPLGVNVIVEADTATEVVGGEATYSPAGSEQPADLTELQNEVTANPQTAWSTGSYARTLDGQQAYWNGTAWVTGVAP
jgi:hypothetical protein